MAKVIYNGIIPFKGYQAITIWPLVFARKKFRPLDDVTINHEGIHLIQQLEVIILLMPSIFSLSSFEHPASIMPATSAMVTKTFVFILCSF